MMKKLSVLFVLFLFPIALTGCEFIGDIFKTGIWVGVVIVVAIAAVIVFIVKLFSQ